MQYLQFEKVVFKKMDDIEAIIMDKQRFLFENLKNIKDYWVKAGVKGLKPGTDLMWSNFEEQYKILQGKLMTDEETKAYEKVMNEIICGVIHSVLVMIDGEDQLSDKFHLGLIDESTKESLVNNTALHEEFYGYLIEVEE